MYTFANRFDKKVLANTISELGYAAVTGAESCEALAQLDGWSSESDAGVIDGASHSAFRRIWESLPLDPHMADGGRYRYRRFSSLSAAIASDGTTSFQPGSNRAFYQSTEFNPLNGGIARNFEPLANEAIQNPVMQSILHLCASVVTHLHPSDKWDVELHPIRTVAEPGAQGKPTPEGIHKDGVDYFFVFLIGRENIVGAESRIFDASRTEIFSRTMQEPLEFIAVNDVVTFHSVTPFSLLDQTRTGFRDALVVNFRDAHSRDRRLN